jgi:hypothetical protein
MGKKAVVSVSFNETVIDALAVMGKPLVLNTIIIAYTFKPKTRSRQLQL